MNYGNITSALSQYKQVSAEGQVAAATPHRLIQMLMDGVMEKTTTAKGHMLNKSVAKKGENLSLAITIIGALRGSLDKEKGGEIAANLEGLYGYMERRLLEANLKNDPAALDEVMSLMREIRGAWAAIGDTQASLAVAAKK